MNLSRRELLRATGLGATAAAGLQLGFPTEAAPLSVDSLPMQLYKSLNDEQREKICLPKDHQRRQFISNWWYVHKEHRVNNTFDKDQVDLIQQIFDSLHHPEHRKAVNQQVEIDQYGEEKNAPSVGFFGTPGDRDFEFIYTGHHVTRRCNAHTDKGQGFGGAPIFYGHFPEEFNETKNHPGNPYWYQGLLFNEFVQTLDEKQQQAGLRDGNPRSERAPAVIEKKRTSPGLKCASLSDDQKEALFSTMKKMLVMFREDDVVATLKEIRDRKLIDGLTVSWFNGKYDIGSDGVWDTWQIEGPEMVWYFRGQPHIHSYFHIRKGA